MDTEIEVKAEQVSITSLKAVREDITKGRFTVDRFTSRIKADENSSIESEAIYVFCNEWCHTSLYFENYHAANDGDILRITSFGVSFPELHKAYTFECKVWLENQNGEKCSETKCRSFLNLMYLTTLKFSQPRQL
jgi:hypothetical protein